MSRYRRVKIEGGLSFFTLGLSPTAATISWCASFGE